MKEAGHTTTDTVDLEEIPYGGCCIFRGEPCMRIKTDGAGDGTFRAVYLTRLRTGMTSKEPHHLQAVPLPDAQFFPYAIHPAMQRDQWEAILGESLQQAEEHNAKAPPRTLSGGKL